MSRRYFVSSVGIAALAASLLGTSLLGENSIHPPTPLLQCFDYQAEHGQRIGMFRPLYEVPERVPYWVYFDLDNPRFL